MEKSSYYGIQAISNSALSYINPEEKGCPQKFFDFLENRLEQKESKAMLTGTLIHSRILEPEAIQVMMLPKISDKVKEIVDSVFQSIDPDLPCSQNLTDYASDIAEYAAHLGYGQTWKPDTLLKKVCDEGGNEYLKMLFLNIGKTMVSQDVFAKLLKVESAIKTNPAAHELLLAEPKEGEEHFNELEIFWTYTTEMGKQMACKSKLDKAIVDHNNMTFKVVDLKTTSESVEFFPALFQNRRIYRQLSFYEMAMESWLKQNYPDKTFKAEKHSVLVAETEGYNRVRRFDISPGFSAKGRIEVKSLMERIEWHMDNNERLNSYEDVLSEFSFLIEEQ